MDVPGPGHYMPRLMASSAGATAYTIGAGQRSPVTGREARQNPGPAHYSPQKGQGVGWTFGRDLRSKDDIEDEPGPGHYEVPASVPDVPKYLQPGGVKQF